MIAPDSHVASVVISGTFRGARCHPRGYLLIGTGTVTLVQRAYFWFSKPAPGGLVCATFLR
ncbi:hypothetical protein [Nocardia sp. NPDC005366]|uniref:hypothetical protein n=1 Tax=Nocardia sp. NPDC005366 TaxID=3156878 RepID=UPI0033A4D014